MFPFLADFQSGSLSRPLLDGRLCILNASLGTWCSLPECQKYLCFSLNLWLHPFAPVRSALWSAAVFLYASLPLFIFRFSSHCFSHTTVSVWLVVSQLSLSPLFRRRPRALDDDICRLDFTIGRLCVFSFSWMSEWSFPCFYPAAFVFPVKIVPVV